MVDSNKMTKVIQDIAVLVNAKSVIEHTNGSYTYIVDSNNYVTFTKKELTDILKKL